MLINRIDVTNCTVGVLGHNHLKRTVRIFVIAKFHVVIELKNWGVDVVLADPWADPVEVERTYDITLGVVDPVRIRSIR